MTGVQTCALPISSLREAAFEVKAALVKILKQIEESANNGLNPEAHQYCVSCEMLVFALLATNAEDRRSAESYAEGYQKMQQALARKIPMPFELTVAIESIYDITWGAKRRPPTGATV